MAVHSLPKKEVFPRAPGLLASGALALRVC
jgi:hypothetical protein